ncbi:hypothetical protein Halru_2506 [Halovivax ruber XH-70]|uniref:KaiC n=1 Tax=Halovivax ruber (strain DSM 18193 / JCM 13892 / XH-70) TaxID=797302 RepID=L0IE23_HALRX|nr:hypothetical protein [Halovivax ruber]AGB17088.1 hypothetical protein Halru_2506 [Halovivax ruber XH-70]
MNESLTTPTDADSVSIPPFPDAVTGGSTVLVAGTMDPSTYSLGLRTLCQYGRPDDAALAVTSTESAEQTTTSYDSICDGDGPSLGLVDTQSERQYLSSLYGPTPTVFTPSTADLERVVIALSELTQTAIPSTDSRHLVVRSVTPFLEHAATDRVCNVLQRIEGVRTGDGIGYVGIQYTEHDEETVASLAKLVDGILWVTHGSADELVFEYQSARRFSGSIPARKP